MKLICGLGNPGRDYAHHRHNVGFMVVDVLLARARAALDQRKFEGLIGQGSLGGEKVLFLEPETYMNHSGQAFAQAMRFYKIPLEDCLVIHDELDLPFGRLQLKKGGGTGGHNGLRSIVASTGEDAFARLRVGIDKPQGPNAKERVTGHVLGGFSAAERPDLPDLFARAADMAECWVKEGLAAAMNKHNKRGS